jgi:hypothetical protein
MKERKSIGELLYQTDPYIKSVCKNPIFIILFLSITAGLYFFHRNIANSEFLMYLVALYFPPISIWIIKALTNMGNSWRGGIVSGHSAYVITVLILTVTTLGNKPLAVFFPFLPAVFVIQNRTTKNNPNLAIKGLIMGFVFQLITIIFLLIQRENWILIVANIVSLLLVIEAYSVNDVHLEEETIFGIILGVFSTLFFIQIFGLTMF